MAQSANRKPIRRAFLEFLMSWGANQQVLTCQDRDRRTDRNEDIDDVSHLLINAVIFIKTRCAGSRKFTLESSVFCLQSLCHRNSCFPGSWAPRVLLFYGFTPGYALSLVLTVSPFETFFFFKFLGLFRSILNRIMTVLQETIKTKAHAFSHQWDSMRPTKNSTFWSESVDSSQK